jgi:glucose-1-phosphate thymidylyltransferase
MIRIGDKVMLDYPIGKFIEAGISDIHVVIGGEHFPGIVRYLGSGFDRGVRFTYSMQDRAGGIAEAIGLAESFVRDEKVLVILGDNIFTHDISEAVMDFTDSNCKSECRLFYTRSSTPERFGAIKYGDVGGPIDIIEKANPAPSNDIITGIYMYTPDVFEVIRGLKPSDRGELEVTDLNKWYFHNDHSECVIHQLHGEWTDCGTFETIDRAEQLVRGEEI